MCRIVRGHENTLNPEYLNWYLRLKDEADNKAALKLTQEGGELFRGVSIKDSRLGPFDSNQWAMQAAGKLNECAEKIRHLKKRKSPEEIASFLASQRV